MTDHSVALDGITNVATILATALADAKRYQFRELGADCVVAGYEYRVTVVDHSSDGSIWVRVHDDAGILVHASDLGSMPADAHAAVRAAMPALGRQIREVPCTECGRAQDEYEALYGEITRYRQSLERIYKQGRGPHVAIARRALDGKDGG